MTLSTACFRVPHSNRLPPISLRFNAIIKVTGQDAAEQQW